MPLPPEAEYRYALEYIMQRASALQNPYPSGSARHYYGEGMEETARWAREIAQDALDGKFYDTLNALRQS